MFWTLPGDSRWWQSFRIVNDRCQYQEPTLINYFRGCQGCSMTGIKDLRTTLSLGTTIWESYIYPHPVDVKYSFLLNLCANMSIFFALHLVRSVISKIYPDHLYSSLHKFTRHTLPPIVTLWTRFDGPEYIQEHIYHLSFSRLEERHCIFLHEYLVGEVIGIDKLINDPEHVRVLIVFQIHPLGKCFCSFLMPIHYTTGGYGG